MVVAVSHDDPDERRRATAEVARSRHANADWAIKGFTAIALLETDGPGRCVAVRALGRSGDRSAAEALLRILNYRDEPPQEVRPPDDLCRWEAMAGLADLAAAGSVPEAVRERAAQAFIAGLGKDPSRHVRDAAARGLAAYPTESAVTALIGGLEDSDFAVIHRCEEALVKLTGVTHHCDPLAWQAWFAANRRALFASAGQVPDSRRPPYTNRWEKASFEMRQMWDSAFPTRTQR